MYSCISVQNLRGIEQICLQTPGRINLLVGRNNAGKTTILEAIFLLSGGGVPETLSILSKLREPFARASTDAVLRPLFHRLDPKLPINLHGMWGAERKIRELTIVAQSERDLAIDFSYGSGSGPPPEPREFDSNRVLGGQGVGSITNDFQAGGVEMTFLDGDSYPEAIRARLEAGRWQLQNQYGQSSTGQIVPATFLSARTYPDPGRSAARFSQLIRFKKDQEVLKAVRLIEPSVQRIEVLSTDREGSSVHVDTGLNTLIPLGVCGEGFVRLFAIAVELISAQGGVLLIDELDNGLHHTVLPGLWNLLGEASRKYDVQVFATTHNDELVRSALEAFGDSPEMLGLFRLDRTLKGHSVADYDAGMREAVLETQFEVRG